MRPRVRTQQQILACCLLLLLALLVYPMSEGSASPSDGVRTARQIALVPANADASAEARKVLYYLADLPRRQERRVISGQHVGSGSFASGYTTYVVNLHGETGKWLGLIGADMEWIDWDLNKQTIVDYWNAGGLVEFSWHAGNPAGTGMVDLVALITPGTTLNSLWMSKLDVQASRLLEMQDAGVVVLWRPFHEMNLEPSSFWWSGRDQSEYINMWRHMFDYFTHTKGLNNILWVYSPNREWPSIPSAEYYYPGDNYVDIVGLDWYLDDPLSEIADKGYTDLLQLGKPFALTEFGPGSGAAEPGPDLYDYANLIQDIRDYCPQAVYFMTWNSNYAIINQLNGFGLMNDPWVLTREALAWRQTPLFVDVPPDHPYYTEIESLYQAGYTAGCSVDPLMYCPGATMNRAESAVFVERGIHGTDGLPPQPASQTFADLPLDSWAAKWAEALWQDHYTAGCGTDPLVFCPWQGHTRAEGCVFYLRMLNGPDYTPPLPAEQIFADVPLETWYAKWVQPAYEAGLMPACGEAPLRFCPDDPLTRGLAARMMVQAKGLP